ncbi:MAG: TonB-dependent receptor, partial [Phenylobacterium sp.]|nr:TonB-dependent receptor [Phenylobacterium sp.]
MPTMKAACLGASSFAALALCAGFAAIPSSAAAQASKQTGAQLEEVVVTARRVEENIQQVPVAVTAVSQQKLTELAVNSIQDMSKLAPSL